MKVGKSPREPYRDARPQLATITKKADRDEMRSWGLRAFSGLERKAE